MPQIQRLKTSGGEPASPEMLAARRQLLKNMKSSCNLLDTCFTIPVPFPLSLAVKPFNHTFHNTIALIGLVTDGVMRSGRRSPSHRQHGQQHHRRSSSSDTAVETDSSTSSAVAGGDAGKGGKQQPTPPQTVSGWRQFKGTEVKVGLQAIIGLIPGLGAVLGFILSLHPFFIAYRIGVPQRLLVWMFINRLFDMVLGIIPFIGDILGAMFKINLWSYRVVERWVEKEEKLAQKQRTDGGNSGNVSGSVQSRGLNGPKDKASSNNGVWHTLETHDSFFATPTDRWYADSSADEDDEPTTTTHSNEHHHPPPANPSSKSHPTSVFNNPSLQPEAVDHLQQQATAAMNDQLRNSVSVPAAQPVNPAGAPSKVYMNADGIGTDPLLASYHADTPPPPSGNIHHRGMRY